MKKMNLNKKNVIYLSVISVLLIITIVLAVSLYWANVKKSPWEANDYYNNKVMSFAANGWT